MSVLTELYDESEGEVQELNFDDGHCMGNEFCMGLVKNQVCRCCGRIKNDQNGTALCSKCVQLKLKEASY